MIGKTIHIVFILLGLINNHLSTENIRSQKNKETIFERVVTNSMIDKYTYFKNLLNLTDSDLSNFKTRIRNKNFSLDQQSKEDEEDHPCEKKTSLMIKHIIDETPLPEGYEEFYKFILYSGTGLNDLGDYSACKRMDIFRFFNIEFSLSFGLKNISLSTGFCYFKECDLNYMIKVKNDILSLFNNVKAFQIKEDAISVIDPDYQNLDYRKRMRLGFLISISLLGFISILPVIQCLIKTVPNKKASIIYDIEEEKKSRKSFLDNCQSVSHHEKTRLVKFFEIFDIQINFLKLTEIRQGDLSHEALKVFDGVRFFSTCWVVLGHVFFFCLVAGFKNLSYFSIFSKSLKLCIVYSGLYAVDVFFFLSAFMLFLGLNRYLNQNIPKIKIVSMAIINRYIRLLPLYIYIIFAMTYINPYLGEGPLYYKSEFLNSVCPKYWWHNLLYINNLIKYENTLSCSVHTWYLANDMQFLLLTLFITIIFNKMNFIRNLIFISMFVASSAYQIYLCLSEGYRFNDLNHTGPGMATYFDNYYIKPWTRICPYLLGIFFCELFLNTEIHKAFHKEENLSIIGYNENGTLEKINKFLMSSNAACAFIFVFSIILINYAVFITYFVNNYEFPAVWHAIFITFNKVLFVFGLAWIIHLTFLGKLKIIKEMLSFRLFSILAKFTYGTYLIHFYLLNVFFWSLNNVIFFKFSDFIFMSIGLAFVSIIYSFILTILLESPVVNATKLILFGGNRKHKQ